MRQNALLLALATLTALSGAGCRSRERTAPSASARVRPSAAPPPAARPSASATARPEPLGCRILSVAGAAAKEAGNPAVGRLLGADEWLDVRADVELSLRHGESAREFSLRGPGRFQVCRAGAESLFVAHGSAATTSGTGVRPGAEMLIGTPLAAIRYADAKLSLKLTDKKLTIQVEQGSATVETDSGTGEAKTLSGPKGTLTLSGNVESEKLVQACGDAWRAVGKTPPRPLPQASAGSGLGGWAVNQLKARRSARFACARARAAVGRLTGAELSRLSGLLDAAESSGYPTGDAGK